MTYWILKTEPSTYSFQDLVKEKQTSWTGVRNYQARNNIRLMKAGDMAVIYHSGDDKAAVGISKIASEPYKEPKTPDDWAAVDIKPVKALRNPVSLSDMKKDTILKNMVLVKNSRLSVSPLTSEQFKRLMELSGTD
jgi:predicted RNA-binding protein with PUA-like domain